MKKRLICSIIFLSVILPPASSTAQGRSDLVPGRKALVMASARLGANYNFNLDDLEEFGISMDVAGITSPVTPCPWAVTLGLQPLVCDTLLDQVSDISAYDAVILMPSRWRDGNAYYDLIGSSHVMQLISEADSLGKVIYAPCAGPLVLKEAGIAQGVKMTGVAAIKNEMTAAGAIWMGSDTLPVIDSNIVTSTRGMFYHIENMEAVITALETTGGKKVPVNHPAWKHEGLKEPGGDILWSRTYGSSGSEGARAMVQTPDGGFLMAGYTWSAGNGASDILLVKTDAGGNQQWMKTIGSTSWEFAYGLCNAAGGGYYVAGYTTGYGAHSKDVFLVKTDPDGNEQWHKVFGGPDIEVGRSVVQTPDGSVLVCGYTQSLGAGEDDILLIKTDAEGNQKWTRTYGGASSDLGKQVLVNSSGEYVLLGSTGSSGAGNRDYWLICTDTAGSILWSNTYGTTGYQESYAVIGTSGGGYLISGDSDIHGVDFLNMYLVKTGPTGNMVWEKNIESPANYYEYGKGLCELADGTFMICGNLKYPSDRTNDLFFCQVDTLGNVLWSGSYGGDASDWGNAVCPAGGNDLLVAGHTFSYGAGESDAWLVRIHVPMVGTGNQPHENAGLTIKNCRPNPFYRETAIEFNVPAGKTATLSVFSENGAKCLTFPDFGEGPHKVLWSGASDNDTTLSPGLYVFVLECGNEFRVRKVVSLGR
jgi:hypothetical protein